MILGGRPNSALGKIARDASKQQLMAARGSGLQGVAGTPRPPAARAATTKNAAKGAATETNAATAAARVAATVAATEKGQQPHPRALS